MRDVTRSEELFLRARNLIPGGVDSPVRAFGSVGGTPRFIQRGEGPDVIDVLKGRPSTVARLNAFPRLGTSRSSVRSPSRR